jgi:ADP-ribosylglycohydrolase
MPEPTKQDRAAGAIMGALIGDALGVGPHWYYDLEEMKADYGQWISDYTAPKPNRYHAGLEAGENSQTGQVLGMLLDSVAENQGWVEADFTARLDALLGTLDGTPHSGRYTDEAMRELWKARQAGRAWSECGGFSDTAEGAIRTPVLAAAYHQDIKAAAEHMKASIRLTHRDPFILGRSLAFGLIVWALINGADFDGVSKTVVKEGGRALLSVKADWFSPLEGQSHEASFFDALLLPAWSKAAAEDEAVGIDPPQAVCRLFGLACSLNFMLPAAYYLTARFAGDFEAAVLSAVNGGGNNMARAALTGAVSGAQVGLSRIPQRFIDGLADHDRLAAMALDVAR